MSLSHEITLLAARLPLPAPINRLDPEAQARYLAAAVYGPNARDVHVAIARLAQLEPRIRNVAPMAAAVARDAELEHGPEVPPPFLRRARVLQAFPSHRLVGDITAIGSHLAGDIVRVVVSVSDGARWHGSIYQYRFRPGGASRLDVTAVPGERRVEAEQAFHFLIATALLEDAADSPFVTGPPDMPSPPHSLRGLEPWIVQRGRLLRGEDERWSYRAEGVEPRVLFGGRGVAGRA